MFFQVEEYNGKEFEVIWSHSEIGYKISTMRSNMEMFFDQFREWLAEQLEEITKDGCM
jgi:hypothetical protein